MSIITRNENKGDEIVDIMETIHSYVPMLQTSCQVFVASLNQHIDVQEARSFPILLHGDFFTAARARGAKKIKINSDSPSSRFEGLVPAAADWHTKLKVFGVRYNIILMY